MFKYFLLSITLFLFCGCSTISVPIHSYNKIAVLEFKGTSEKSESGGKVSSQMISDLMQMRYYKIIEREELKRIIDEQRFSISGLMEGEESVKLGKLLGADAMIFGNVTSYKVEEYKGKELVKTKLAEETKSKEEGEAIEVKIKEKAKEKEDKDSKKMEVSEKETGVKMDTRTKEEIKTKEVLVTQEQISKKGLVSVNMRMVDIKTGSIIQSKTGTKTVVYIATTTERALRMPSDEYILEGLTRLVVRDLTYSLSPNRIGEIRKLLKGKDSQTKLGVKYAQGGLWSEACETWKKALEINPNNAYSNNNIGVYYEKTGDCDKAIASYKKALDIMPDEKVFMENLYMVKKYIETNK